MFYINKRIQSADKIDDYLELPFDQRQKSRLRITTKNGLDGALLIERGHILRGGDLLGADNGMVIQVIAAPEPVYKVTAPDPLSLMCAAYHLGNRHVPLQVCEGYVCLEQDYVLKEMLVGLGMRIEEMHAPFEPEAGAYGGGHRHGGDDDDHHTHQALSNLRQPTRLKHG